MIVKWIVPFFDIKQLLFMLEDGMQWERKLAGKKHWKRNCSEHQALPTLLLEMTLALFSTLGFRLSIFPSSTECLIEGNCSQLKINCSSPGNCFDLYLHKSSNLASSGKDGKGAPYFYYWQNWFLSLFVSYLAWYGWFCFSNYLGSRKNCFKKQPRGIWNKPLCLPLAHSPGFPGEKCLSWPELVGRLELTESCCRVAMRAEANFFSRCGRGNLQEWEK